MNLRIHFPFDLLGRKQLMLILAIVVSSAFASLVIFDKDEFSNNFDARMAMKNGDLVFRKGRSLESQAVLISDRESAYSHVGIVYILDSVAFVIHTVPDESDKSIDYIKMEKLAEFFSSEKAIIGSVLRAKKTFSYAAQMAAIQAKSYYDNKLVFDDAFDLKTEDKLYCTELVWKAYQDSGLDLVEGKFDELFFPLSKGLVVLPSSLLKSYYLEEIYFF